MRRSSKAPSPLPSPSGGGCRPQGRPERENAAGPQCENDRSRGGMQRFLPFASGHVLPLPSSASRGIGGCHLPPLGAGKGGCEFAGGGAWLWCCCAARRVGAPYNELTRIRPNAFMWEDPAAECRGRRSLQISAADSPDVAAHLRCCCGTGHGLDAVPYKALLSCFDGDSKRNNKCPQIMDAPPALRAIRARLCGMGVLFNTLLPPQAPPKKIPGSWDFLHSAHEIPPCAAEKPCKSSPLAVR